MSVRDRARLLEAQSNHGIGLPRTSLIPGAPENLVPPQPNDRIPDRNRNPSSSSLSKEEDDEADVDRRVVTPRDGVNFLSAPHTAGRSQSSYGRLQTSNIKTPPAVPHKSKFVTQKLNALQLTKSPHWTRPELPSRPKITNNPLVDNDDEDPIILVDNDLGSDAGHSPQLDVGSDVETVSPSMEESEDGFEQVARLATDLSKHLFGNFQNFVKINPPTLLSASQFGRKISEAANPLVSGAKDNLGQAALVAKPLINEAGRGLQKVGAGASSTIHVRLGIPITQPSDRGWNASKAPLRYRLLDGDSEPVGNVLLDVAGTEWLRCGRYEFLQIAEAQYSGLDNKARDVDDCPLYVVILVEWDEQRHVASRLGLGRCRRQRGC